jgi:hypothetical protein
MRDQISHSYKTRDKIMVMCIYIFIFFESKQEVKGL